MEQHKLIVGETILVDCKRFFPSHPSGNFPVFFLFFSPLKWAWSWSNDEAQLKWSSTVAVAFLPPGFSPPSPSLPSEIVIVLFVSPTHTIHAARHAPCQRLKPSVWCQLETPKPNSVIYNTSNLSDSTSEWTWKVVLISPKTTVQRMELVLSRAEIFRISRTRPANDSTTLAMYWVFTEAKSAEIKYLCVRFLLKRKLAKISVALWSRIPTWWTSHSLFFTVRRSRASEQIVLLLFYI